MSRDDKNSFGCSIVRAWECTDNEGVPTFLVFYRLSNLSWFMLFMAGYCTKVWSGLLHLSCKEALRLWKRGSLNFQHFLSFKKSVEVARSLAAREVVCWDRSDLSWLPRLR